MSSRKVLLAICVLWFWMVGHITTVQSAPRAAATVLAASGTLNVQRAGQNQLMPLRVRTALHAGDMVVTGRNGFANLMFDDGSEVKMRQNSRLEILSRQGGSGGTSLFRALLGGIWARLRPGRSARTVYTNLVVRGTEFHLEVAATQPNPDTPDNDEVAVTLTVIEGTVDFSNQFGKVSVNASQQSIARKGEAPTRPVTIANTAIIIEWTQEIDFAAVPREKFWITRNRNLALQNAARLRTANADDLQIGEALFDAGNIEAALAQFEAAGNGAGAQIHRGHALLKLGRLEEAEAAFGAALPDAASADAARLGLAWTMLERNRPIQARELLTPLVAAKADNSEARLALAIALMREVKTDGNNDGNNTDAAIEHLKAALNGPEQLRYQARAWLAGAYLSQGENDKAQSEAEAAAQMAPDSVLTQSQLATVSFFNNRPAQALRAARRVVAMDESASGQMALAQAALAAGRIDDAATAAARAVALDDKSPQAHYLLGIADASRRDYRHAIASLRNALQIAPEFYPALNTLVRIYVRAGREKEAGALLAEYEKRPENYQILSARAEYLYNIGQYKSALAAYRRALELRPGSALTWANLARTAIDANHLAEAIDAGQQAVQLAPDISAYHSILGLAYDFSLMRSQAERSYRTALALDSNDALALFRLGLLQREGDPRLTERRQAITQAQSFLFQPDIAREFLRGGVNTEIEGRAGNHHRVEGVAHHETDNDARLNVFANAFNSVDNGDAPNTDFRFGTYSADTTYLLDERTTLYTRLQHRRADNGLNGLSPVAGAPASDDRNALRLYEGTVSARRRLGSRSHLWAGLTSANQTSYGTNPNQDFSSSLSLIGAVGTSVAVPYARLQTRTLEPEMRFDYDLTSRNSNTLRSSLLSIGFARPRSRSSSFASLFLPSPDPASFPSFTGQLAIQQTDPVSHYYAQWQYRKNRLSMAAQLRYQSKQRTASQRGAFGPDGAGIGLDAPPVTTINRETLPNVTMNWRSGKRSNLRLIAGKRSTDIFPSVFAPIDASFVTEEATVLSGLPDPRRNGVINNLELDSEVYFGRGGLARLTLFRSTGSNITYDFSRFLNASDFDGDSVVSPNTFDFDRISRRGVALRVEHPVAKRLFVQAVTSYNRTAGVATVIDPLTATPVTINFGGRQAPYNPRFNALLSLNYISQNGFKSGLFLNHNGAFFQDTADPSITPRPRFGSSTSANLLFAYEPSPRGELFLTINNLFDKQQIVFNNVPLSGRRFIFGVKSRF